MREDTLVAENDVIKLELSDPLSPSVESGHLYLPCEGPVNQVVLDVDTSSVPQDLTATIPGQFVLVFAGGVISTVLVRTGKGENTFAVKMTKNVLRSVREMVQNTDEGNHRLDVAKDVSTGYTIKGRHLGARANWLDYALGTVTFTCGTDDDRTDDKVESRHPSKAQPKPENHKFDHGMEGGPGGFDHSFFSAKEK